MKRAPAILAGVAMVCVVAYLSWLNPTRVDVRLSPTVTVHDAPLAALLVVAFIIGASLILMAVTVQAGRRAFTAWRQGRHQRRIERIDDWEERGEQLVWAGDTQQGRALLQKAWQRRPETAHAVLALATSYRDTGELQRARQLLVDAANHHHTNPDVLLALADAHHLANDPTGRVEVLERLRALHPRAPRALQALRDCYVEADRWRDATPLQEALLAELRDPGHATRERDLLTLMRYQSAMTQADVPARLQVLEGLADSRAGSVPISVSLGDTLVAAGRQDEASVLWERALRSTPRTAFVERLIGIASEPYHRERLRTVLRKLRADLVNGDNVLLLLGHLLLLDGDADAAARELSALKDPLSAPPMIHRLLAEVHRRHGNHEQAVMEYARANGGTWTYECHTCRRVVPSWTGYCTQCSGWDSYRSEVEIGLD